MDFKFNSIKRKRITEDFNFNDVTNDDSFNDSSLVDTFFDSIESHCNSYFKKIFTSIEDYNIDVAKTENGVRVALHRTLLVLKTYESSLKIAIDNIIGNLIIHEDCTNIKCFDDSFPRYVSGRLTIDNHIENYENCADCNSLVINDKKLTEFDFDQLPSMEHLHFVWFNNPDVNNNDFVHNIKNIEKFLKSHSYTSIVFVSYEDINLLNILGLDPNYYQQISEHRTHQNELWNLNICARCSMQESYQQEYEMLKENIEFDKIHTNDVNDNIIQAAYEIKVQETLEKILMKYYNKTTNNLNKCLVECEKSKNSNYTFDILLYDNDTPEIVGSVRILKSGVIDKLCIKKFYMTSMTKGAYELLPEISSLLYYLLTTDLYFNNIVLTHPSGFNFVFDSMNSLMMPENIQSNFPFDELEKHVKSITFNYIDDAYCEPSYDPTGLNIDSSSFTLLFGYGELYYKPTNKKHMYEIGKENVYELFYRVLKNVFNADLNYNIQFVNSFVNESVEFNKVDAGEVDYDLEFAKYGIVDKIMTIFKSVYFRESMNVKHTMKENGFVVYDNQNKNLMEVTFGDDSLLHIKKIRFNFYDKVYTPQNIDVYCLNIFNHLLFLSELNEFRIDVVHFWQNLTMGVVPYILHNDTRGNLNIEKLMYNKIIECDDDLKAIQQIYPVSRSLKHIDTINFHSYAANLIIDESIAFKNTMDYTQFKNMLNLCVSPITNFTLVSKYYEEIDN